MKRRQSGFTTLELLLLVIILGIVAFVGYYVYNSRSKTDSLYNSAAGTTVAVKTPKKTTSQQSPATTTPTKPVITNSLKENVADSVKSGNTAALEGYMTSSVTVVIAGSEKGGAESAAKAIMDLDYLNYATAPWNFSLDSATLAKYQAGAYKQYFTAGSTIVGQSANDYLVSFGVNSNVKINTVFMSATTDQLK